MACDIHPKVSPNRKSRVTLISHGMLTNILPSDVILPELLSFSLPIVKAPVSCKVFIEIPMSLIFGGCIHLPKISVGSYLSQVLICKISFSNGHLCISGLG